MGLEEAGAAVPELAAMDRLVQRAREVLGPDLRSVVLFGSAAENRLRPTSDVNLIFVLARFDPAAIDGLRGDLRLARTANRLDPMFLLESEVADAAEAFAVKFDDVRRRRRVIFGSDPFGSLAIPREAMRRRAVQVLLNLELRIRRAYAVDGDRPELLFRALVDAAGPLRAAAATVLELRGGDVTSGRVALSAFAAELADPELTALPDLISNLRQAGTPQAGTAGSLLAVGRLAAQLRAALNKA